MNTSIEDKLASLRSVQMPHEPEQAITSLMDKEIAKYRRHNRNTLNGFRRIKMKTPLATMLALAAVCIIVPIIVMHGKQATYSEGTHSGAIAYSAKDLTQIKHLAGTIGISPIIPTHGGLKARFETVTKYGPAAISVNYSTFRVVESKTPLQFSPTVGLVQTITLVNGMSGAYFTTDNAQEMPTTDLYFKFGQTYTTIESVKPGSPLSTAQSQKIANSLRNLK